MIYKNIIYENIMKHLKSYENIKDYDEPQLKLKKYIIYSETSSIIKSRTLIMQILYNQGVSTSAEKLYIYQNNELIKTSGNIQWSNSLDLKPSVIFTSDNLQECIDKLPILLNQHKYNI